MLITLYEHRQQPVLEAFEEAVNYSGITYNASRLRRYGFKSDVEVAEGIKRAIQICKVLGINTRQHFSYFYKVDILNHQTYREWKLSKLGFYLVLCNGEKDNPFVGALQFEMLKEFLFQLD